MFKRNVQTVLVATALSAAASRAAAELWDLEFNGNDLPDPAIWVGSANSSQYNQNDKFTSGDQYPGWLTANGNPGGLFANYFNTNTKGGGWTVEWKFLSHPSLSSQPDTEIVQFSDDFNLVRVSCTPDTVTLRDHIQAGETVSLDTKSEHLYRLVRQPGSDTVQLYIDLAYTTPAASFTPDATGLDEGNLNHMYIAPSQYEAAYDFWHYHSGAFVPSTGPQWSTNGIGDWNNPANWAGPVPNAVDAVANFLGVITAGRTVVADTAVTVGTLKFDNANTYNLSGVGSLTVEVSTGSGSVSVVQGSQKINLPLFFASDTNVDIASGAALTIADPATIRAGKTVTKTGNLLIEAPLTLEAGAALVLASGPTSALGAPSLGSGAKIDLQTNSMTVDYRGQSSPATTIKGQIAAASIMSSSASSTTGLGWKDDAASQSILVKYTYLGDTNLDGQVDVIDLGNLATAWQTAGVWVNGDSNYDNFVDVIDLGLLATNWQAGVGSPLGPGSLDQALAAYGLPGVSVPEPASVALLILGVVAVRGQRARRIE